ncbi:MAG: hypothetical protein ABSF75_06615 [Terracidiphilus sp.]
MKATCDVQLQSIDESESRWAAAVGDAQRWFIVSWSLLFTFTRADVAREETGEARAVSLVEWAALLLDRQARGRL